MSVGVSVPVGVRECVGGLVGEGLGRISSVGVGVRVDGAEFVAVGVASDVGVLLGCLVRVAVPVEVALGVGEVVEEGVCVGVEDGVTDAVTMDDGERVREGETVGVDVLEVVAVADGVRVGVGTRLGERVGDGVGEGDHDIVAVSGGTEADSVGDAEGSSVGGTTSVGVGVEVLCGLGDAGAEVIVGEAVGLASSGVGFSVPSPAAVGVREVVGVGVAADGGVRLPPVKVLVGVTVG